VPQTRIRAIFIASRVRQVGRPMPTHSDPRKGPQLFTRSWVNMAEALGFGATAAPSPSITAGGTSTGGAEPFPTRARDFLAAERGGGRWTVRTSFGTPADDSRNGTHEMDPSGRPAHTVTGKTKDWALRVDAQANATVRDVTAPAPAPALKFGHSAAEMQWIRQTPAEEIVMNPNSSGQMAGYTRPVTEPSPVVTGQGQFWSLHRSRGAGVDRRDHPVTEPAPAITSAGGKAGANLEGRLRSGESRFAVDSVRITVEEAAALQSFRPGYPFQGSRTARFRQIGDAVPPILAAHVLAMATGMPISRETK